MSSSRDALQVADATFDGGLKISYYMHGEGYNKGSSLLPHPFWQMKAQGSEESKVCCRVGVKTIKDAVFKDVFLSSAVCVFESLRLGRDVSVTLGAIYVELRQKAWQPSQTIGLLLGFRLLRLIRLIGYIKTSVLGCRR